MKVTSLAAWSNFYAEKWKPARDASTIREFPP